MKTRIKIVGRRVDEFRLILLVSFIWFMVQFLRYVFPPLFGTFQASYGVSSTQTGFLFTLLMLGYSAVQFPAGLFADRFGAPRIITGGIVVFTAAAVAAFFATTFQLLLVAAVVIGAGTGVHKTVAIPYLSKVYPQRTGRALGTMDTIGQFGGIAAPIVVTGLLATVFPWRTVFLGSAFVSAILAILFYTTAMAEAPDSPDPGADENGDITQYVTIFTERRFLLFLIVTTLFTFAWNAVASFFPLYLSDQKGFSTGLAGLAYSVLFAASLSQVVTGDLSDRFGKLAISLVLFLVMIASLVAIIATNSLILLFLMTALMGVGFHGFRPVRDSYLVDLIPDSIGGGTLGVIRTIMTVIGALAPVTVGFVADRQGFVEAFGLIVVVLTVSVGVLVVLRE